MNNKGFTLVEVLAVIAIIAIIGLVAIPGILNTIDTGKKSSNDVLYNNIRVGLENMYEEIQYGGSNVYIYDVVGGISSDKVKIVGDYIIVNIQTLVGNGFLTGINNEVEGGENSNTKVILNSDKQDIGKCEVKIIKEKHGNKICYEVVGMSSSLDFCPVTDDFGGDNQCN